MKKAVAVLLAIVTCLFFMPVQNAAALQTSAKAYAVINAKTGTLLACGNENAKLPMASTTKIMTALILAEQPDMQKTVKVTKEMVTVEGSSMGLLPGDTVSYNDLLYGLLLASGNDAANTVATVLAGSIKSFAKLMNKRARQLGLYDTHFENPSGLHDDNHYTTARDLCLLAAAALKNKRFAKACGSKTATLCYGNPPYRRTLKNHNKMLNYFDGAIGVKTGFTKAAGRCLVSAARQNGKCVIAVTLNDPNDWQDHAALLEYGLGELEEKRLDNPLKNKYLPAAGKGEKAEIYITRATLALTRNEWQNLTCEIQCPQFLYAPVKKGQTVGRIEYSISGRRVETVEIKAKNTVSPEKQKKKSNIMNVFLTLVHYLC